MKRKGIRGPKKKPANHLKPWSEGDVNYLSFNWGVKSIEAICKHLKRTQPSVIGKAEGLELGSMNRGKSSLDALAKETGYDRGRILTAAKRVLSRLPRAKSRRGTTKKTGLLSTKGRHYAFDLPQVELILEELAKHPDGNRLWVTHYHEWGGTFRNGDTKPDRCLDCERNDVNHHSKGRCRPCHERHRGATNAPRRISRYVWKGRNPPHCKTCGKTDSPHNSKGDCQRCYQRRWRRDVVGLDRVDDPGASGGGDSEG